MAESHPPLPAPRIGVLLVNLGTPDAPERGAVKRYLREFLSDRPANQILLGPRLRRPVSGSERLDLGPTLGVQVTQRFPASLTHGALPLQAAPRKP